MANPNIPYYVSNPSNDWAKAVGQAVPAPPASIAAPPTWQQSAGIAGGGGSVPAGSSTPAPSGSNYNSLIGQLGMTPATPTAPMYTSSAQPAMAPHINTPTTQQMRTQSMPISGDLHDKKIARQQNTFNGIANAINSVTNEVQKKKYENITTDVTNVSRAQSQIASAQQAAQSAIAVLKPGSGANEEQKRAAREALGSAQKVITTNQASMDMILSDDKRRKEMAKAFQVSFTDPEANAKNKPFIDAGKTGLDKAKEAEAQGLHNNTPEEKAVADFNKATANNGYAGQFMNQQPQQLTINPQYEQQYAQYQAQQKYIAQYVVPKLLEGENQRQLANINNQSKDNIEHYKQFNENIRKMADIKKDMEVAGIHADATMNAAITRGMAEIQAAQVRVDGALRLARDPKVLANKAVLDASNAQTLAALDTSLTQQTNQLKTLNGLLTTSTGKDKEAVQFNIKALNTVMLSVQEQRERLVKGISDATTGQYGANGGGGTSTVRPTTYDPSDTKSPNYGRDSDPGGETDPLIAQAIANYKQQVAGKGED